MALPGLEELPSLLLFGSNVELPSGTALEDIRQELINNPSLTVLKRAVLELPEFWTRLVDFDPDVGQVPGLQYTGLLKQWIDHGEPLPGAHRPSPNLLTLTVTFLLQITQYTSYLRQAEKRSHVEVLRSVQGAGIQGFCTGFLSAVAVASSKSELDIGELAATSLHLAVCAGAYVDRDGAYSSNPTDYQCLAVRWRGKETERAKLTSIIDSYPDVSLPKTPARIPAVRSLTDCCRRTSQVSTITHA